MNLQQSHSRFTLIMVIALLFYFGFSGAVQADWEDRSDELLDTGPSTTTVVLLGLSAAAVVTAIILYSKSGKDKTEGTEGEMKEDKGDESDSQESSSLEMPDLNDLQHSYAAGAFAQSDKKLSVNPYLGLRSPKTNVPDFSSASFDLSEQAVVVGLAVRF